MTSPLLARTLCSRIPIHAALTAVALCLATPALAEPLPSVPSLFKNTPENASAADAFCFACHGDAAATAGDASARLFVGAAAWSATVHGQANVSCRICHLSELEVPHRQAPDARQAEREGVVRTCGGCHQAQFSAYEADVHGRGFLGDHDGDCASCMDCHGPHQTTTVAAATFRVAAAKRCIQCHTDEAKMNAHGLSAAVVQSYLRDFHGATFALLEASPERAARYAVCVDCHGAHGIKTTKSRDASSLADGMLPICQECHFDAAPQFTAATTGHARSEPNRWTTQRIAGRFYDFAIPGTVGAMVLYIALETIRSLAGKLTGKSA